MMAQGYGNSEIADRLVVTERAVHKHVGNIFVKLDLPARTAATGASSQFSPTSAPPSANPDIRDLEATVLDCCFLAGQAWDRLSCGRNGMSCRLPA